MRHVYLDLNLFHKVKNNESINAPQRVWYEFIYNQIVKEQIFVPYSNGHINDLKQINRLNESAVEDHIKNIKFISNDLCLLNYWGDQGVTWQYRDIEAFLKASLHDSSFDQSFEDFIDNSEFKDDYISKVEKLKLEKLPQDFKQYAENNAILKLLFPRGTEEQTQYALCEDVFKLNTIMRRDYTVFTKIKSYINDYKSRLNRQGKALKLLEGLETIPSSLNFIDNIEEYIDKNITSKNPSHNIVTASYFKKNFEGNNSDINFSDAINKAIHAYYASHCEYFITTNSVYLNNVSHTYRHLKIKTKVMTPKEYYSFFNL